MKNKILIGTLSKMFDLSKQTLIHYDHIGLLKPTISASNGYRYYEYEDLDKLDLILSLKDTGLSLSEIKDFMKNPSSKESIHLLTEQNKTLDELITKLQQTKNRIDYKIKELNHIATLEDYHDIRLIEKEERYIVEMPIKKNTDFIIGISNAFKILRHHISNNSQYHHYRHAVESVKTDYHALCRHSFGDLKSAFIFIDRYHALEHEVIVPAGMFMCIRHHGLYSTTYTAYEKLMVYLENHGLEITNDAMEIPLITAWSTHKEENFITEIQVPVKKKKN